MDSGNNVGPTPGAVDGFDGGGGGSEDIGASGGGGGYSGGGSGTHNHQVGVEEEARIAVGKAVQVYLVGTYVITALCKLMNGWAEFKILIDFHIRFSFTYSLYSSSHSNNWGS